MKKIMLFAFVAILSNSLAMSSSTYDMINPYRNTHKPAIKNIFTISNTDFKQFVGYISYNILSPILPALKEAEKGIGPAGFYQTINEIICPLSIASFNPFYRMVYMQSLPLAVFNAENIAEDIECFSLLVSFDKNKYIQRISSIHTYLKCIFRNSKLGKYPSKPNRPTIKAFVVPQYNYLRSSSLKVEVSNTKKKPKKA